MTPPAPTAILGVGAVSPLGPDWPRTWRALCEGRGAVAPISRFDATDFPCQSAAVAPGIVATDRRWQLALPAATEALNGLDLDRRRMGIFIGSESGRATLEAVTSAMRQGQEADRFSWERFVSDAARVIDADAASPSAITTRLAEHFGLGGPRRTLSLACASSAAALVDAVRALRLGHCQTALVGGVGADVDPIMLAGFGKLGALSARGCARGG